MTHIHRWLTSAWALRFPMKEDAEEIPQRRCLYFLRSQVIPFSHSKVERQTIEVEFVGQTPINAVFLDQDWP